MFNILYRTLALLKERKKIVLLLIFTNLIFSLLILVEPLIFKEIIDTLILFNKTGEGSLSDLMIALGFLLILFLNWKLGLLVLFFGLISGLVTFYSITKAFTKQNKMEKYFNKMSSLYSDTFANISAIKSFTLSNNKKSELK